MLKGESPQQSLVPGTHLAHTLGFALVTAAHSTSVTQLPLCSVSTLVVKAESPGATFGTLWSFSGQFLPEAAADLARLAHRLRRIAKLRRAPPPPTQAQVSQTCACELLPYIEENLFPYIQREIYFPLLRRGGWTDRGVIGSGLRSVLSDRNVASNLTALSLGIGPQRSLRCLPEKACTPDTQGAMAVTPADLEV